VESYGSVKSADYESLLTVAKQHGPRQSDKSVLPQPSVLRLLGTEFLVLPDSHRPAFAERIADSHLRSGEEMPEAAALWKMTRTVPRLWIVHDVEISTDLPPRKRLAAIEERAYKTLFPGDRPRDFSQSAVIETNDFPGDLDRAAVRGQNPPPNAAAETCEITHYSPQRVVAETQFDQPALLVLSDAWYPGWKAVVTSADGRKEVPIYRANRVLRGIWLPAGRHTIEYRFQSQTFFYGAIISGVSWPILGIVLTCGLLSRRRRSRSTDSVARP